jgi:hypothetical protein
MNQMTSEKPPKPAIEAQIVENLRRAYNAKLEEQVPDRLLDLLKALKRQEQDDSGGGH